MDLSKKLAQLVWALGIGAGVGAALLVSAAKEPEEAQSWMGDTAYQPTGAAEYDEAELSGGLPGDDEPPVP
jgi:hypothetical protein